MKKSKELPKEEKVTAEEDPTAFVFIDKRNNLKYEFTK